MENEKTIADRIGEYCLRLLLDVVAGELDGKSCTVSERLRAATYLHRMYIDGDLQGEEIAEDWLSQAIREAGLDCDLDWCEIDGGCQ